MIDGTLESLLAMIHDRLHELAGERGEVPPELLCMFGQHNWRDAGQLGTWHTLATERQWRPGMAIIACTRCGVCRVAGQYLREPVGVAPEARVLVGNLADLLPKLPE